VLIRLRKVLAEVIRAVADGDKASLFVLAVEANVRHGLPLSAADRKAAASRIISCYPQWSDRLIASVTGIAAKTVAAIRQCPAGDGQHLDARSGRDGRVRPRDSAGCRTRAGNLMAGNPGASLRDIARQAGIPAGRSAGPTVPGTGPGERRADGGGGGSPARSLRTV